jgi:hypothetical protein
MTAMTEQVHTAHGYSHRELARAQLFFMILLALHYFFVFVNYMCFIDAYK